MSERPVPYPFDEGDRLAYEAGFSDGGDDAGADLRQRIVEALRAEAANLFSYASAVDEKLMIEPLAAARHTLRIADRIAAGWPEKEGTK